MAMPPRWSALTETKASPAATKDGQGTHLAPLHVLCDHRPRKRDRRGRHALGRGWTQGGSCSESSALERLCFAFERPCVGPTMGKSPGAGMASSFPRSYPIYRDGSETIPDRSDFRGKRRAQRIGFARLGYLAWFGRIRLAWPTGDGTTSHRTTSRLCVHKGIGVSSR